LYVARRAHVGDQNSSLKAREWSSRMISVDLSNSNTNHTQRLVKDLSKGGWHALIVPADGVLQSNRQLVELRSPANHLKIRFCIFAVGDRGESHRRDERRIQITTTYLSGLARLSGYTDIVLGYDATNDVYVGLDARRLQFGGQKHNASSFVDPVALEHTPSNSIAIRPHDSHILGLEYQAIFKPRRLTEYIFNVESIHEGLYVGNGWFSENSKSSAHQASSLRVASEDAHGDVLILRRSSIPRPKHKPKKSRVTAYENGNWKALADVSPEELEAIRRRWCEIGDRGEYFAFQFEKQRLRKSGQITLARKVDWISRRAVGRGYDIKSYETDGSPRYVEVKSTSGSGMTFVMSDYEWRVAVREKGAYYIYRVVDVDKIPTLKRMVQNPVVAEKLRKLERTAAGWKIALR
jgi:hypothetical protein